MPSEAVARCAVVVLTLDAAHHLPSLLTSLSGLKRAPQRVLFIDSSSSDGTVAAVRAAGHGVHVIARADFGHGRTRNEALLLCPEAEFVVFLTQDACPQGSDWLERLLEPFTDARVALAYGRQLARPGAGWPERHAREFNYPDRRERSEAADLTRRGVKAVFCSNSFAAYRRSALQAVGGFPERLPMGEDMAAALRLLLAGYVRVYEPSACAVHSHAYGYAQELRRYFDIGVLMSIDPELRRLGPAASGEGLRFLRSELAGAWQHKAWSVVDVAMRAVAKSVGFFLGRRYSFLPQGCCRHLSMHRHFWSAS
jgi:rhamnosyltransferase